MSPTEKFVLGRNFQWATFHFLDSIDVRVFNLKEYPVPLKPPGGYMPELKTLEILYSARKSDFSAKLTKLLEASNPPSPEASEYEVSRIADLDSLLRVLASAHNFYLAIVEDIEGITALQTQRFLHLTIRCENKLPVIVLSEDDGIQFLVAQADGVFLSKVDFDFGKLEELVEEIKTSPPKDPIPVASVPSS